MSTKIKLRKDLYFNLLRILHSDLCAFEFKPGENSNRSIMGVKIVINYTLVSLSLLVMCWVLVDGNQYNAIKSYWSTRPKNNGIL